MLQSDLKPHRSPLHIDRSKLQPRTQMPLCPKKLLLACHEGWGSVANAVERERLEALDDMAIRIPWREPIPENQRKLFTHLAVQRAHEAGRGAQHTYCGERERKIVAVKGLPDGTDPLQLVLEKEPGSLERCEGVLFAQILKKSLGVELSPTDDAAAWIAPLRMAGGVDPGRPPAIEARIFIKRLAFWWYDQTGKRPNGRTSDISERLDRKRNRPPTFLEFVQTAWASVGGLGSIHRNARTAIDELNRADSPPSWIKH